ncbi:MAG: TldD/PmbA family protein [Candidatus Caldatribacterium sp.]|nr:TldD/PmbA family protein [Candidatus Caldatribacterium sp.]
MLEVLRIVKRQGLEADLFVQKTWSKHIEYEAGVFKGYSTEERVGCGLRVIRSDKRLGFYAFTPPFVPHEVVDRALEVSAFGDVVEFPLPSYPSTTEWKDFVDPRLENITVREMVEIGVYLLEHLRAAHPDVLVNLSIAAGKEERALYNHHEEEICFQRTFFRIFIEALRVQEDDILTVYAERAWGNRDIDIEDLLKEVQLKLDLSMRVVPVPSGEYPVLFTPQGCMVFLYPLLYGLNGKNIVFGQSPLRDKLGKVVLSSLFSLVEAPREPWALGSCPFDDEGVLTPGERFLVERGRIEDGFWDLWSASKARRKTTASGFRRSPWDLPEPGFSVLKVRSGLRDRETLVEEIEEGLVVDSLLGLGQSNIASGAFSCGVQLGFYVKGGEIQGRVKNIMISGNAYNALRNIKEISRDSQWVQGSMLIPYILVEPIQVNAMK